jgi:phytoene dehydrogenase-like protein
VATSHRYEIQFQGFVLAAQSMLFDTSPAPQGKHIAWAYCHVPNGSRLDRLKKLENQIERFCAELSRLCTGAPSIRTGCGCSLQTGHNLKLLAFMQ